MCVMLKFFHFIYDLALFSDRNYDDETLSMQREIERQVFFCFM